MILVSGVPRSGTTWMGKILSHPENVTYYHEPDNEHNNLLGYIHKQKIPRFPYLTSEDSQNGIFKIYKNVIDGNYLFGYGKSSLLIKKVLGIDINKVENEIEKKEKSITSPANPSYTISTSNSIQKNLAKKFYNVALLLKNRDLSNQRILIKSVHSILALSYLQNYFNPKTVVVLRHPANIISSHIKLDNPDIWRNIFKQDSLLQDHLGDFKDQINKLEHPLAKAGAQVSAFYFVLDKQLNHNPDWIVARHEDFCRKPRKKFKDLFEKLDLNWSEEIRNQISDLNEQAEGYVYKRVAENQINKWKRRLDESQVNQIKKGYSIFPQKIYSGFI